MAINLNLDGVYIPSFNKKININLMGKRKNFLIIGSAHSIKEIKIKEKQGVKLIFLSPVFKINKSNKFLDIIKFNLIALNTNIKIIALGGINKKNINKLNILNKYGFAGISYFQNSDKLKFQK